MTHPLILILHNITSFTLALVCWWLAHQNARVKPPGRAIALGYSLVGFGVLVMMLIRNTTGPFDFVSIVTKCALIFTCTAVSYRRHKLRDFLT